MEYSTQIQQSIRDFGCRIRSAKPPTRSKGIRVSRYLELKQQAEALMVEAEKAREKELDEAITQIKLQMQILGVTLQDLRQAGIPDTSSHQAKKAKAHSQAKYRGPNGELWSGGRGRKPDWVMKALKDGKSLEQFAVARH